MSLHRKKSSLEQSSSSHNEIHDIINPKYLKKETDNNLKFPQACFYRWNEKHIPANPFQGMG